MSGRARSASARHVGKSLLPALPPAAQLGEEEIRAEATAVRRRVETLAPVLGCPPNLRGMCSYGAMGVYLALRDRGVRTTRIVQGSYGGMPHFWTEVGALFVDVTASQFGDQPPVVVLPVGQPSWWPRRCYRLQIHRPTAYGRMLMASGWWGSDEKAAALHATLSTSWWLYPETRR